MAVVNPPPWLQNSGATNTAQLIRLGAAGSGLKGPTASSPNSISGKGGVLIRPGTAGTFTVSQNGGGNMSVNVSSGLAYTRGTENVYQGGYWVLNDAQVNLAVAASDPTNNRTDSVYVAIRDSFYSGANNDAVLTVATGNPATPTTPPTLPFNALELYRITVRANTTSILTGDLADRRPWLTATGGITPVRSFEVTDPGTIDGDASYVSSLLRFWDSASTVWRTFPHYVSATTDISNNATIKTNQITYDLSDGADGNWKKYTGSAWIYLQDAKGIQYRARRTTVSSLTTSIVGVLRLDSVLVYTGRSYRISVTGMGLKSTVATDIVLAELRFATGGATATTSSSVMNGGQVYFHPRQADSGDTLQMITRFDATGFDTLSLLYTISRNVGTGNVSNFADASHNTQILVEDMGPAVNDTGVVI